MWVGAASGCKDFKCYQNAADINSYLRLQEWRFYKMTVKLTQQIKIPTCMRQVTAQHQQSRATTTDQRSLGVRWVQAA
jgi:hypothetical protein